MIVATAATSIAMFLVVFWLSGIMSASATAIAVVRRTLETIRDARIDDVARETAVQRASIQMIGILISILARGVVTLGASMLPIWLGDAMGLVASEQVFLFLSRWDVIVCTSIVIVLGYYARVRLWPPT